MQASRGLQTASLEARLQHEETLMSHPSEGETLKVRSGLTYHDVMSCFHHTTLASNDGPWLPQVQVLEREQEETIIKCRCKNLGDAGGNSTVFAFIRSSVLVDSDVGCQLIICHPWKTMQLSKYSAPLLFVYHAHNL